jgi:cardiolipin synthase
MGRVLLVPLIVWALLSNQPVLAFYVFVVAGLSDAVDGTVARALNQQSEFGTILDPIADKLMLVSVFIVLAYLGHIPLWLAILVVSRDLIIVLGVMLAFLLEKEFTIRPLWVSKVNTAVQIVLAALVLGILGFEYPLPMLQTSLEYITGVLTAASAVAYIVQGLALFANGVANQNGEI